MSLEAVIFDWGGTLTPWHKIDLEVQWHAFAADYAPERAKELAHHLYELEESRWKRHRETSGALSTGALSEILTLAGVDMQSQAFERAFQHYLDFWKPHTFADPDAMPLLRALKERGLRVGVLSNTMWPRTFHEEIFERDGLAPFIDAAVYTSELQVGKPHRAAFEEILNALHVEAKQALFVGDRLWDDIHGAQAAGMPAVFLPHSDHRTHELVDVDVSPNFTINKLGDVFGIVRSIQKSHFES